MSLFAELKRRNVFRVGAAYAVASWVLLQVLDVVGEILEIPPWGGKLLLAILLVGFIVVLFVAWAYELTPEGIKRQKDVDRSRSITHQTGKRLNAVIIILMGIAIGYLLLDKFYLAPRLGLHDKAGEQVQLPTVGSGQESPAAAVSRQSIAVLPFENRSRREEDEFFVEGVHDDLLTSLARIGSLKVISRTSVGRYRGTDKTIPEIAAELGVASVMEGAVQRAGNTVRINVQLIDAQTDEHLWAEIFDRELTADNLFAIQSEISSEIARALEATLTETEQNQIDKHPTENLAAYDAYLKGRQLMARRTAGDLDQAAMEFQRAVDLDPGFALAWVGIAETAYLRSAYSDLDYVESIEIQEMAAERALSIDPDLGEAYPSRAMVFQFHERHEEAEAAFRKAIELSPGYATAWHWYGTMLMGFPTRLKEAGEKFNKALELDPLSSIIRINLADLYTTLGQYQEAGAQLNRVQQLDPEFLSVHRVRAQLAFEIGRFDEQIRSLRKAVELDPRHLSYYQDLAFAHLNLGQPEALDDIRQSASDVNAQNPSVGIIDIAGSLYRGRYDGALEVARWTLDRMGNQPFMHRVIAYVNLFKRDYTAARAALEMAEPRYFEREKWREAIVWGPEDACLAGFLLLRTGDAEMGNELLVLAANYLENELPLYIEHADRYGLEQCWAALGQNEAALAVMETRVEHGHYGFWWWWRMAPMYEPLWGEPRFEAALKTVEDAIAAQRANLTAADGAET